MTRPRRELVSVESTPYYHCISRCVRRAFLWGEDSLTGKNHSHRKQWVIERLSELAGVFAIDVCAYAVLSDHYHLVLRVDRATVEAWTHEEIVERWQTLFKLPPAVSRYQAGEAESEAERKAARRVVEQWRTRLADISWFMRLLNESLARRANAEDGCTGRFWEGRFKSQALLDEAAVLTCMSYVDLNPIRAGIAERPETSAFTSIEQRLRQWREARIATGGHARQRGATREPVGPRLMPLVRQGDDDHPNAIGFTRAEYLALVDWAGRAIRDDKRGHIPAHMPPVLTRLGLSPDGYVHHVRGDLDKPASLVLGRIDHIKQMAARLGRGFFKGLGQARMLYQT